MAALQPVLTVLLSWEVALLSPGAGLGTWCVSQGTVWEAKGWPISSDLPQAGVQVSWEGHLRLLVGSGINIRARGRQTQEGHANGSLWESRAGVPLSPSLFLAPSSFPFAQLGGVLFAVCLSLCLGV